MQGDYFFLPLEHVIFGAGSLERLPGELERLKVRRALIITGQSLATKTGIVRKVEETLGAAHAGTFSAIRQHTPESDVARAVEEARRVQTDILISLGGGSPIDATKAVARALAQSGGQYLPHLAIPTTLSAAEFSHLAGVTNESGGQPIKGRVRGRGSYAASRPARSGPHPRNAASALALHRYPGAGPRC